MGEAGGKRAGAGRPKGVKNRRTIEKEAARNTLYNQVVAEITPMIRSQIENAKGISYLIVRQKSTGKFLRVPEVRAKVLNDDEEVIEVWEKDPNVNAFTDLMNRALGKPIEQIEMQVSGEVALIESRLLASRARMAARKAALPAAEGAGNSE